MIQFDYKKIKAGSRLANTFRQRVCFNMIVSFLVKEVWSLSKKVVLLPTWTYNWTVPTA